MLVVSAAMPSRRRRAAAELADWLETETGSNASLADVGRALAKRNHGRSRAAVLATTHAEAITGLRALANGKPGHLVFSADAPVAAGPVWVLSGFGAQHRKMAKQLYLENAVFRAAIDEVDELIVDEAGYSVKEMYLDDAQDYDVGTSQVGIFGIQVGLAALLRHHGAEPSAVVGHSMGEIAAAYISGGLALEDAVRVICARSRLMGEGEAMLSGDDIRLMALVEYSSEEITGVLGDFPNLEVAVYAAPTHTVIGGPEAEVNAIVAHAEAQGKLARLLQTKGAGHTSQMDPLLGELAAELAGIEPQKLKVGLYSTVDKETFYRAGHEPIHDVDYWVKNMRHSVWFTNAVRLAVETGHTTYLELAPNPVALMQVAATTFAVGLHDAQLIGTLKRKEDESAGVLSALAQLYVYGHAVDVAVAVRPGWLRRHPANPVRAQAVLGERAAVGVGQHPDAGGARRDARRPARVGGAGRRRHRPRRAGRGGRGAGARRRGAGGVDRLRRAADLRHADHHAHPAPGWCVGAGARPRERCVPAAVRGGRRRAGVVETGVRAGGEKGTAAPEPAPTELSGGPVEELPEVVETFGGRWDPNSSESLEDRLAFIVAESMGYAPEDLPAEIPLIELGLDSLMAVRIKNRVEYEFDIPQLQLQAVRDANLVEVGEVSALGGGEPRRGAEDRRPAGRRTLPRPRRKRPAPNRVRSTRRAPVSRRRPRRSWRKPAPCTSPTPRGPPRCRPRRSVTRTPPSRPRPSRSWKRRPRRR